MKKTKRLLAKLLIFSLIISSFPINTLAKSSNFKDWNQVSSWALEDVGRATDKKIVEGNQGYFKPKADITRAEFTKIIVNAFNLRSDQKLKNNFKDVKDNFWYTDFILTANELGIVQGSNNKFRPNSNISRQEMAAILNRTLEFKGLELEADESNYTDSAKISNWAKDSVNKVSKIGIMQGSNKKFNPLSKASREMATVSIMRAYDYLNDKTLREDINVRPIIDRTGKKMYTEIDQPQYGTIAGEWTILALARGEVKVPKDYYDIYYNNLEKEVVRRMEKDGYLHRIKRTENSRLILALTSIGKDPRNVGGYNLLEGLTDMSIITKQGINGPVFALIAFDTLDYEIPEAENKNNQVTREKLIDFILGREIKGGGWELGPNPKNPDPDITAMTIQALAPYYNTRKDVKLAVDRGINILSKLQRSDGGYHSWGSLNSESVAQVVVALTALGIDPHKDLRFIKNGNSALENLLTFENKAGGFYHVKPGGLSNGGAQPGSVDPMATDQAMYALVAYDRFINNKSSLYNMTDIKY